MEEYHAIRKRMRAGASLARKERIANAYNGAICVLFRR
ncbi:hypothetical protein NC651_005507 [Populus alba x Populus x berolinensis]|nr:hypothetical protein NC651_005507 [Populus alba x Populus x berolinensis]